MALFVVAAGSGFYASWRSLRRAPLTTPAPQPPASRPTTREVNRDRFYVVAFPIDANVMLRTPNADKPPVPLRRAVLLSLAELDESSNGTIGVWEGDREHAAAVRSLTFVPPKNAAELVDGLNAAIASWGPNTDWRRAQVEPGNSGGDGVHVRLILTDQRGRQQTFDHSVRGDSVVPIAHDVISPYPFR